MIHHEPLMEIRLLSSIKTFEVPVKAIRSAVQPLQLDRKIVKHSDI